MQVGRGHLSIALLLSSVVPLSRTCTADHLNSTSTHQLVFCLINARTRPTPRPVDTQQIQTKNKCSSIKSLGEIKFIETQIKIVRSVK